MVDKPEASRSSQQILTRRSQRKKGQTQQQPTRFGWSSDGLTARLRMSHTGLTARFRGSYDEAHFPWVGMIQGDTSWPGEAGTASGILLVAGTLTGCGGATGDGAGAPATAGSTSAHKGVVFVGFDASEPLVDAMRQGKIQGLVVQNPIRMGELSRQGDGQTPRETAGRSQGLDRRGDRSLPRT